MQTRVDRRIGFAGLWGGAGLMLWSAGTLAAVEHRPALEEVVVEGVREGLDGIRAEAARVPGGVTVVDMAQFEARSASSLADVLRYVPGVWSASSAGNDQVFLSVRGSNLDATDYDGNGVKLLQDGLPVTTADGNNHNRVIDPLGARAATIARGANGMAFGASTLGGAINFVTPTAVDRSESDLRLTVGSHGLGTLRATASRDFESALDALITVEAKTWDGYRNHSSQHRQGVYANAGWRSGSAVSSRFYGTYLRNEQQLPGSLTRAEFERDAGQASAGAQGGDFRLDVETWRLANRTTWQLGEAGQLEAGVSLERQKLYHPIVDKILVDFDGPGPLEPTEVFSLLIDTDHEEVAGAVRYARELAAHDLAFGVNFATNSVEGAHFRNDRGRRNGLTNRIDNDAETWEVFVEDHWALNQRFTLVLAMQAVSAERRARNEEIASGTTSAPGRRYSALNPRLGFLYRLGQRAEIYGNLSRLYEPPTHFELEDDVRGGNRTLKAMQGRVVELGARGSHVHGGGARWYWDATAYRAWVEDEILSVEDPLAPGTNLASNVEETVHAGVEVLLAGALPVGGRGASTLEPTLSATWNHFEFVDDPMYGDANLPAAPDYAVRGEVLFRHPSGYYFGPTFERVGRRWADFSNTYGIDGYDLLGLRAGWDGSAMRVFLEVQNLLDEDYVASHGVRTRASSDTALLNPGAPLSVYAGLAVSF